MKPELKNNRLKFYIPLAVIVLTILVGVWYWYKDYSSYITTDDAHVDADNVGITSKMMGRIAAIYAKEGDIVQQGVLLADLDSSDLVAQRNQVHALKNQSQANLIQAQVKYSSDEKSIKVLEIGLERAKEDFARAKAQSDGGVISQEQFDHSKKALETASAQLDAAMALLKVSKTAISTAAASVSSADAQINVINTQLKNVKLYAPASGIIAKQWLQPGDVVQPSQSVLTLIQSSKLWIAAFLEETKISEIHPGQDAVLSIDAFPGVKFAGKIFVSGSSTASVFSLIPANNASGNFTKVTQRIPIKISIDKTVDGSELSSYNILSGMSAVVKIIRDK